MSDDLVLVEKYMILAPSYISDSYRKFYACADYKNETFDTFEEAINYLKNSIVRTIEAYESPEGQAALNRAISNGLPIIDKFNYILGNCIVKTWQVVRAEDASPKALLHAYHLNKATKEINKQNEEMIEW